MKHLLLEVFCDCNLDCGECIPKFCEDGIGFPGVHCFSNICKYLSYTKCPNEISFAGSTGLIESFENSIGFGGTMEPEECSDEFREFLLSKWKDVCLKKIREAHSEYMTILRLEQSKRGK